MKRHVVIMIVFTFVICGCQNEKVDNVTLYKGKNFSEPEINSKVIITEKHDIGVIARTVKNAKRQPGMVDVAFPEYMFIMNDKSYYLWLDEIRQQGSLMPTDDTVSIYSIPNKSAKDLILIVEKVYD